MTAMKRTLTLVAIALLLSIGAAGAAFAGGPSFYPVDVVIDTHGAELAAWQVEITYPTGRASLAGIEGGDRPFAEPPYYDPKGLSAGRVIIASFTLDAAAPRGRVRVATLHLMDETREGARLAARLVVAAGPDGDSIDATVTLNRTEGGRP
jgi:hypothetical protein